MNLLAFSRLGTMTVLTSVLTNGFITEHAGPSRFTLTFKWNLAFAVDTTRQSHTLGAIRTRPSDSTFAVIRSGTISIAYYAGRITDGVSTKVLLILITRQTHDMSILVTNVVIVCLDVFSNASNLMPCVGRCKQFSSFSMNAKKEHKCQISENLHVSSAVQDQMMAT